MSKNLVVINSDGIVVQQIKGYDESLFNPISFADGEIPLIINSDVRSVSATKSFLNVEGKTYGQPVLVSPATEQFLNGTIYGEFFLNETLAQSQFIPEVVNYLVLDGLTADDYRPVVASMRGITGLTEPPYALSYSSIGDRAAKFAGSYLGTDTKAAGLKLPAFSTVGATYTMLSGFLYFESIPGSYDPIIITRTADGVNASTKDSFRLEYDVSSNQIEFHFATSNTSAAGMPYVMKVCPVNGVSTGFWHQFAIAYSNIGGSACASAYWNGVRTFQYTGISGSIKNSTDPLMIGSGASGDKPLNGYLEHIMISSGGDTLALREFNHGATAPIDPGSQFAGDFTVYAMSMNGPIGTSLFPCENTRRVMSSSTFIDPYTSTIGTSNTVRENTSIHGSSLFVGTDGGHAASSAGSSTGYLFGINSGACMTVNNVTSAVSNLKESQSIKGSLVDHTISYLLGSTAMRGASGSSGDFPRLFSGPSASFSGTQFSFFPTAYNVSVLRSIYDDITLNGRNKTYYLADAEGAMYSFATGGVKNLYNDVVSYQGTAFAEGTSVKNEIASAATVIAVNQVTGFSAEAIIRKLAPQTNKNAYLYLSGKGRETKKTGKSELQAFIDPIGDITEWDL